MLSAIFGDDHKKPPRRRHHKSDHGPRRHKDGGSDKSSPERPDPKAPRDRHAGVRDATPKASRVDVRSTDSGDSDDEDRNYVLKGQESHRNRSRSDRGSVREQSQVRGPASAVHQSRHGTDQNRGFGDPRDTDDPRKSRGQIHESKGFAKSRLSQLGQDFVRFEVGHYVRSIAFINQNQNILAEPEAYFWDESKSALLEGALDHARRCVQQALLLRGYRKPGGQKAAFITGMLRPEDDNYAIRDSFLENVRQVMAKIGRDAGVMVADTQPTAHGLPSRSAAGRHSNTTATPKPNNVQPSHVRHYSAVSNKEISKTSGSRHGTETFADTVEGYDGARPEYKIRGSKFFIVGRVFLIKWFEGHGTPAQSITNPSQGGPHGQDAYSSYRRMVVVREQHGCSWCLPVYTYQRQGLTKRGFSTDDINMHSVIHTSNTNVHYLEGERQSIKRPIVVHPASPAQKLDRASRLNFSKIHTVEHNNAVADVGIVAKESLPYLLSYWKNACAF